MLGDLSLKQLRIGLYSVGLREYWKQFDGLLDRLLCYNRFIEGRLSEYGRVYNYGLADNADVSHRVAKYFGENRVDIVFLHSATYFTSDIVIPVQREIKAPCVVLNLQPSAQIDYDRADTGEWLAQCIACPVPELSNAFERAGIPFHCVSGLLGLDNCPEAVLSDERTSERKEARSAWRQIGEWCAAARVKKNIECSNFGYLGGNYSGMLDLYSDFTMLTAQTGIHIEILEMCDLATCFNGVSESKTEAKLNEILEMFDVVGEDSADSRVRRPEESELFWSAKVAAAQEELVKEHRLDALSYYYHSTEGNKYEKLQSGLIVGNSLLTANGVPCAGEADIKTALAMKICDLLDAGGSFSEIVVTDYNAGTVLVGHDGPFHIKIADGKPLLRGMDVYHGKKGSGISVEARVRKGPVTLFGVTQTGDGKLKFIVSEAEALDLPIMKIGNTQTHVKFNCPPDEYMLKWFSEAPTHHFAMAVGHIASVLKKIGVLMGVKTAVI